MSFSAMQATYQIKGHRRSHSLARNIDFKFDDSLYEKIKSSAPKEEIFKKYHRKASFGFTPMEKIVEESAKDIENENAGIIVDIEGDDELVRPCSDLVSGLNTYDPSLPPPPPEHGIGCLSTKENSLKTFACPIITFFAFVYTIVTVFIIKFL